MSAVDEILADLPLRQLADRFGTDQQTMEVSLRHGVSALLGRMQGNAHDPAGAAALAQALVEHAGPANGSEPAANGSEQTADGADPLAPDTDGERILDKVFGDQRAEVLTALTAGLSAPWLPGLMPGLAQRTLDRLADTLATGEFRTGLDPATTALLQRELLAARGGTSRPVSDEETDPDPYTEQEGDEPDEDVAGGPAPAEADGEQQSPGIPGYDESEAEYPAAEAPDADTDGPDIDGGPDTDEGPDAQDRAAGAGRQ